MQANNLTVNSKEKRTFILDTNVYGELLIEKNSEKIIENIRKDNKIYVYGLDIIERELEDTPIEVKYKNRILKKLVINIYELIIKEELKLIPLAKHLASEYYKKFDELRKSGKYYKILESKIKKYTEEDLIIDFQIIAIASLKNIDIVVSTDKRTILSEIAENTYNNINKLNDLRTPELVKYSEFKKRYSNEK
ncbi:MAG: hypothetical protein KKG75_02795 [Nanoarchaeota archaeon]|nr:hypothetical protein [Nanoarchaeota archaeon]